MSSHPFFSRRQVVYLLATLCCLLWGSAYPAVKSGYLLFAIGADDIAAKMLFAGDRFVLAGLLLLLMACFSGRPRLRLNTRNARQIVVLGLTQTSLQYVFFYVGLAYTTGVKSSIMNATGTFFSVLLAHFIYHNDRLSFNKAIGCLVGFAGVMVVNFGRGAFDFHFSLVGEGFIVIAAFVLAAASIYGKKVSQTLDAVLMTGYQLAIGGAVLVVAGYAGGGVLGGFTAKSSLLLLYLALLSSVSFGLWTLLLKYNRVGLIAAFNFLVPIFGALLSALFLGETILEWKNLAALLLVCSGIWLVTRDRVVASVPVVPSAPAK